MDVIADTFTDDGRSTIFLKLKRKEKKRLFIETRHCKMVMQSPENGHLNSSRHCD